MPIILKPALTTDKAAQVAYDDPCTMWITVEGMDEPLPLEEYVLGVVAGEMPANFQEEALKAQAIAARTYALRSTGNGKKPIAATVSAQVYKSKAERRERWGKEYKRNEQKLREAVEATRNQVIEYEGEMITAMFFSTSNGKTEAAQNYSGNAIPYLQSVDSPGEAAVAPQVERQQEMTLTEWNRMIGSTWNAERFTNLQLVRNQTGRVQKAVSNNFEMSGRDMRDALGLPSTDFNIAYDVTNQIVHVTTQGYGHGVGMSQYGAEAFAQKGWTANQILAHYYTGTSINNFENNEPECLKTPPLANNSK